MDYPISRKAQRVSFKQPVSIRYNREGNFEFSGVSKDLSASGIFLYTDSVLEEGAHVELTLTIPSKSVKPLSMQVHGRVIRVEQTPVNGVAVEFNKMIVAPDGDVAGFFNEEQVRSCRES